MDSGRRRSSSFHTDLDLDNDIVQLQQALSEHPEYHHASSRDTSKHISESEGCSGSKEVSSSSGPSPSGALGDTEDAEPEVRVRSRSRSVHQNDDLPSTDVLTKSLVKDGPKTASSAVGGEQPQPAPKELVGPIKSREALALRQVKNP
jgi:hypothetical protein